MATEMATMSLVFTNLDDLREPLLAARLLREEILATPIPPARRSALDRAYPAAATDSGASCQALVAAARLGGAIDFIEVSRGALDELAAAVGSGAPRTGVGEPFHGQSAPAATAAPALFEELLETVNSPRSLEGWSPVLRAFALHFLLRLVQPFEGPPGAIGQAAEALVLASDGLDARRMRLSGPADPGRHIQRPDPNAFALERAHALVDALGRTRDELRHEVSAALLRQWATDRASGLNLRQRAALLWLEEAGRTMDFRDYITLSAGRGGAGLRSLQRDWRALRALGWVVERTDGRFELATTPLEWGN
jgi:hypothetical protein